MAAEAHKPKTQVSLLAGQKVDCEICVLEGGREGKFRITCKTIKMLLTGNLKQ